MQTADLIQDVHELDRREGDGIAVSLLWHRTTNSISIFLLDDRADDAYEFVVPSDRALDAFRHPFAYAAREGLLPATELAEPIFA